MTASVKNYDKISAMMIAGISLAAIGTVLIFIALCMVGCYIRALSWEEVPAEILDVRLYSTGPKVRSEYLGRTGVGPC